MARKNTGAHPDRQATYGTYHITIATKRRQALLGEITDRGFIPSDAGGCVEASILLAPEQVEGLAIIEYRVAPTHVYLVVALRNTKEPLFRIVGRIKSIATRNRREQTTGQHEPIWMRGYTVQRIHTREQLNAVFRYVRSHPASRGESEARGNFGAG